MANGIVDAARYNLVPQIPESNAFAQGMRAIAMGKEKTRQRERMASKEDERRQAGVLMQILESGDNAGQMINQFSQQEPTQEFKNELMQLQDIYQQDPQTAMGIVTASLRGSEFGMPMLDEQQRRRQQMQRSASARGFAPQPVQVSVTDEQGDQVLDEQGNPVYETQMLGIKFDPSTGQYSTQRIDTGGDILAYEQSKYAAREMGKGLGESAVAGEVAKGKGEIEKEKAKQKEVGKAEGEAEARLEDLRSGLPAVEQNIDDLLKLSERATYTGAGRAFNAAARQLGFEPTEGATARAQYEAIINNQTLPMLRRLLGAQFTDREGDKVAALLGDPNLSPAEKKAQLSVYIDQYIRELESAERRAGATSNTQRQAPTRRGSQELTDDELLQMYGGQ